MSEQGQSEPDGLDHHELLLLGFERIFTEHGCGDQDAVRGTVSPEVRDVGGMDATLQRCASGVLWVASFTRIEPKRPDKSRSLVFGYTETAAHELCELRTLRQPPLKLESYANIAWAILATDNWKRVPHGARHIEIAA